MSNETNIYLVLDGNAWIAMTSHDLQAGLSGSGDTPAMALRSLADQMEKHNWRTSAQRKTQRLALGGLQIVELA